jgi:hypothetical protein
MLDITQYMVIGGEKSSRVVINLEIYYVNRIYLFVYL